MIKRIGIVGAALVTVLALSGLGSSTASASFCALVSKYVNGSKAGNWDAVNNLNGQCLGPEQNKLTARWVLVVELKQKTLENLYCARLLLAASGEPQQANGYYETELCEKTLLSPNENKSDFTEVIIPFPVISRTLSGSSYPLDLNYSSSTVATKLEDGNGALLEGKGLNLLLLTAEESESGTFDADFLNVEEASSKKKCHTSGDKTATVLSEGSFLIVYTDLSPLELGLLFLPSEVKVECEGVTTRVRGDVISSINGASDTGELTTIKGKLEKGSTAGSQEITEYYNAEGTKVKAKLIAETGGVEHASNEQVKEETTLTAAGSNMFEIVNQ
jgi:hypothetical protein